ncbi:hypothetical protein SSX86_021422 [Deinandra increscens subsp. villosa]|uniref:Glutamate receptor n=1 Tax=Deinandra increscens subsp. villosa TaxID=3103831 RepID=A0AAP0CPR8_9ASTR
MQHHHHHYVNLLLLLINLILIGITKGTIDIGIGVILDMDSSVGKTGSICINMALHDFYQTHNNYTTKIVPYFRDSKFDRVQAASAAIQLIKDVKVMAIIGPQRSSQADFVVDIGNKARVPILSLATTPSLSPKENPYFIRVSHTSSSQAQRISDLIKSSHWQEVVFVYQDGDFGTGFIPSLSQALLDAGVQIKHRTIISQFASDHALSDHLHNLRTNQTRVFVVHLLPDLASRFFKKAKQEGMMQEEYAWIITDVVTNLLHTVDTDSMQGVVGVKPNIPISKELKKFEERFKRNNPREVVNVYGLWLYDTTYALAMALERVGSATTFQQLKQLPHVTDLDAIGTSKLGPRLISEMNKTKVKGLSGNFSLVDRELQSDSPYQIVNIVGGKGKSISNQNDIIWPGGSRSIPRGWEIPATKDSKLQIGYPEIGGFPEFIEKTPDMKEPQGFCIDVFKAIMEELHLPHSPSFDYIPYPINDSKMSGSYKDLVDQIYQKKFDVVVGDVTIRADRSNYVDFTLPYTDSGVSMIVPIKKDDRKNAWIFLKPLEKQLWLTTCGFFIYIGVVVWVLEHQVNKEFRGRPYKQVGMIFWFSFSTLVFAHKEKMISNLSRFVVIVWVFVVLVLQSSYIASLTSILTVQQLQPDFTEIHDLIRQGEFVGYKEGSFVKQMLVDMGFEKSKLIGYAKLTDYDYALSNGRVSAIFDELPYLKLFLANHCNKYIMVGPTYKTAGFGFAFPKGSPLLPLVSKALLTVTENKLDNISNTWLGQKADCGKQNGGSDSRSGRLSLDSFWGLFLIAGVSSTSALIIYLGRFLYENKDMLLSDGSIRQKLSEISHIFQQEKQEEIKQTTNATTDDDDDDGDDDDLVIPEDSITNSPLAPENHQASDYDDEAETTPPHDVVETRN